MWTIWFTKTTQRNVGEWVGIFFQKRCFLILFWYIEDPIFLPLEQFHGEFKWVLFKIEPSLSFLLSPRPDVFCSYNDKHLFLYFRQFFLYRLPVIWYFSKSLLKKSLHYSKLALLSLSSIGCSYGISFLYIYIYTYIYI